VLAAFQPAVVAMRASQATGIRLPGGGAQPGPAAITKAAPLWRCARKAGHSDEAHHRIHFTSMPAATPRRRHALAEVIAVERRRGTSHTTRAGPVSFDRRHSQVDGIDFQDVYNIMLRCGWTLGTAQLVPVMHAAIRPVPLAEVRILERHWAASRPDMVVSLIPHYNRAFQARR